MATNSAALIMSIISQIEASDFDRLYEIEQQAHLVPWSFGTLKNNQGERYLNLKLIENNQIIGFAICQTVLDEATLFNIAIVPTHQGNGLGKLLLNELIAQLKKSCSDLMARSQRVLTPLVSCMKKLVLMKSIFEKIIIQNPVVDEKMP